VDAASSGATITNTAQVSASDQTDPDSTPGNSVPTEDDQASVNITVPVTVLTNGMNASNVLGQAGFTTKTTATTQSGMSGPEGVAYDAAHNRLFVADTNNQRVLVFSGANITNGQAAVNVLGQTSLTTATPATTQSGMRSPTDVEYDATNNRLFVTDRDNQRVLVYDVTTITNGMNAANVLGQADFISRVSAHSQSGLSTPITSAYDAANHRLFVVDGSGNRVLVYDVTTITNGMNAVHVLGQTNFTSSLSAATQSGMSSPLSDAYDSAHQRLFVGDGGFRVLVYNVSTITDGMNAANVLGQANFTSSAFATTQSGLRGTTGIEYDAANQRLFVAGNGGNRVLVYNVAAITNGMNATNVLGEPDFTTGTAATTQSGMNNPYGVSFDATNQRLFVVEINNNRVLVFDLFAGADLSLTNTVDKSGPGIGNNVTYTVTVTNGGGLSTTGVSVKDLLPAGLTYVSSTPSQGSYDSSTGTWTVGTISNGASPTLTITASVNAGSVGTTITDTAQVLASDLTDPDSTPNNSNAGEDDQASVDITLSTSDLSLTNTVDNPTPFNGFNVVYTATVTNGGPTLASNVAVTDLLPAGLTYVSSVPSQGSYVSGTGVWTVGTIANGATATITITALVTVGPGGNTITDTAQVTASDAPDPDSTPNNNVASEDDQASADITVPVTTLSTGMNASNVLGQSTFTTSATATTQSGMFSPRMTAYDAAHDRLFVVDQANNRVLVFAGATITDGQSAVNVLGQPNFTSNAIATTQAGMNGPRSVIYDAAHQRLFVSELTNNRVLVFDVTTITDGMNAVNVLGQPNFTTGTLNTASQAGLRNPNGLAYDATRQRLFVCDVANTRILVYDVSTITDGMNGVNVLGQPNFTSGATNVASQSNFNGPIAASYDAANDRLFVADFLNNRVMVFNVSTITDGMNAVNVLGQLNFTASTGSLSQSRMNGPGGVAFDAGNHRLYVSEETNNRVIVYDLASITNGMNATLVIGQPNFTTATAATTQSGMRSPIGITYETTRQRLFVSDFSNNRVLIYNLAGSADLSLTNTVNSNFPKEGDTVIYTVTASNSGPTAASGVIAKDLLPAGLTFVSSTPSQGTYVSSTGIWTVGTIVNGASKTLAISATVNTGTNGLTATNTAEITASDIPDPDSTPNNHIEGEDDQASIAKTIGIHTSDQTTANAVQPSRSKAGVASTFNIGFTLVHVLNGTTTVTFADGFTVTGAPTAGTCASGTIDTFGFSAQNRTFTAEKHNCTGAVTLTGGTVINPSLPGLYRVDWVNDDPGGMFVVITSEDQASLSATINGSMKFRVVASNTDCDHGDSASSTDSIPTGEGGTVALGSLLPTSVGSSDIASVSHICTFVSTNAGGGYALTVKSLNGQLKSLSNPADAIPPAPQTSGTATFTAGTPQYGMCLSTANAPNMDTTTPAGSNLTGTSPFAPGSCTGSNADGNSAGKLTTDVQTIGSNSGGVLESTAQWLLKTSIDSSTPPHNDYADTLTFIATGTF
jgi:uncharacterized repeat protein (TIGR01451 family)